MTSTHFIGVRVDALTFDEFFERVDSWLQDKTGPARHVACINAYCATLALEDPRLAAIYARADIAGADGMPFVHWMRAFVRPQCDRLYGPDVIAGLAERARERGYTFYFYGGAPDVLESMRRNLQARFPHLRIVGTCAPPFRSLTDEEDQAICNEINRLQPDFVLVGLGTPKQDYWIEDHRDRLPGTVLLAVGAAFDFFGGRIKMAPSFVQRAGFEWLYRLAGPDFTRLWRRYTIYNAKFLWHFAQQLVLRRHRPPVH